MLETSLPVQRQNMIDGQLRTNRVTNAAILAAMGRIMREKFLPTTLRGVAYIDEDVPLGNGRFLMEPMVFARLAQALNIQPTDIVLIVGGGCGYGTAVLSELAATVMMLEENAELADQADARLQGMGVENYVIVNAALSEGVPQQGPYHAILFEGAVSHVPQMIQNQLAPGGRMAGVVVEQGVSRAWLWRRTGMSCSGVPLFDARTPVLPGIAMEPGFVF